MMGWEGFVNAFGALQGKKGQMDKGGAFLSAEMK